jgi:hypothetical protein
MSLLSTHSFRRDLPRRAQSLAALGLFLLGTNFCVFSPPPELAGVVKSAVAGSGDVAAAHGCCGAATAKAARADEATRQATAPCCVAVAPVVAAHGATLDEPPVQAVVFAPISLDLPLALPAMARLALAEDARPPALRAATPDAGRAPPRL